MLRRFFDQETAWFQRGEGGFLTYRPLFPLSSRRSVPQSRLTGAKRLGAIIGMGMVFGQSSTPISPALLQYIIHNGNLHSLTRAFVAEWFPGLVPVIDDFIAAGTEGDLAPFQSHLVTYLDLEVRFISFSASFC